MTRGWEESFRRGVAAFRAFNFEEALQCFDEAIELDGTRYNIYDSRAATYEKLGKPRDALRDSRMVIELAPEQRHGYARSARLFYEVRKYSAAKEMVRCALERISEDLPARRRDLEALQCTIEDAISRNEEKILAEKPPVKFPFFKLPVELIYQIFDLVVQSDKLFPFTACLVCNHWRAFTLNRPEYWGYLILSHRHPIRKMKRWLERSRNRITDLRITGSISLPELNDALKLCNSEVFKALKTVDFEAGVVKFLDNVVLDTPISNFLYLRDIRLSPGARRVVRPDGLEPHPYSLENVGNLSPLISETALSSVSSLIVEDFTVIWEAVAPQLYLLHTLVIKVPDLPRLSVLTRLLGANTGLQQLVLATEKAWGRPLVLMPMVENDILLPHLVHLELLGPMDVAGLMSYLCVPALVQLYLYGTLTRADNIMDAIHPTPTALTEFSIRNCTFTASRIVTFLQHLMKLEKVEITLYGGDIDPIVDVLSQTHCVEGAERLMHPSLRHVNFSHSPNLNGGPIVRLVKSRLAVPESGGQYDSLAKLEEIRIDHCPRIDPSVPEWLRRRVGKVSCVYMTRKEIKRIRN